MKKFCFILMMLICGYTSNVYSQASSSDKNILSLKLSLLDEGYPAPTISYERIVCTINNSAGVGIGLNLSQIDFSDPLYSWLIGAQGSFHYTGVSKWDFFSRVGFDFDTWFYDVYANIKVGANYMFSNHFGIITEVGYGIEIFSIGLNYNFSNNQRGREVSMGGAKLHLSFCTCIIYICNLCNYL